MKATKMADNTQGMTDVTQTKRSQMIAKSLMPRLLMVFLDLAKQAIRALSVL